MEKNSKFLNLSDLFPNIIKIFFLFSNAIKILCREFAQKTACRFRDFLFSFHLSLLDLNKNSLNTFSVGLSNDNLFEWDVCFEGPIGTLYEVKIVSLYGNDLTYEF